MTVSGSRGSSQTRFSAVDLALMGVAFIWGAHFSVAKVALTEFSPISFACLRFSLASLLTLALLCIFERSLSFRKVDTGRLVLLGVIGAVFQLCFIGGIAYTTASNSSLITATMPIFIALLSSVLGSERVERSVWHSVILSFTGIILIVGGSGKTLTLTDQSLMGDLLILAAMICWSAYTVLSKPLLQRYTSLKLATLAMVLGIPLLVLVSIPSLKEQNWGSVSLQAWLGLVYSFSLVIAIAQLVWYTGISRIGSARTSLYSNLTPVIALAIAWTFLSERMTLIQVLGAVLVFASLYLSRKPSTVTNNMRLRKR